MTTPRDTASSSHPLPLSLRAAALALVFGSAHAQQSEATVVADASGATSAAAATITIDGVRERDNTKTTSGGKFETALRDVPQSVTVMDRKMLDSQAAASLKDALRNVPGITLGAGEGGVIGDNINLRGFSARTDIYLDGMRDRGQYSRDNFMLEAIEVLKGPSSMLFGRGSTGGVINQISKKPDLKDHGEIGATVGTDDYYRATAEVNRKLSATSAARIAVFGQDIQAKRDVVRNQDWGVAPSVRFGINTPTEVILSALVQRNRDLPDYGFPFVTTNGTGTVRKPVDADDKVFYGYTDDHFNQAVNVLNATVQHKFSADTTLRNRTMYSHNRTDASPSPLGAVSRIGGGTASMADPLALLTAPRQDRDRTIVDTSINNQTDLQVKLKTGSVQHTLVTGFEIGREESREDRYAWNTTPAAATVNLGAPQFETRSGDRQLSYTLNTTADTLAVYANDQIDLTPQWKLVAGLRGERFKASSDLVKYTLPSGYTTNTTAPSTPKSETMWSPRAGVLYQPTDRQSWYVSYGTSFNPSAETVTQSSTTASLDAEKNRSLEAGVKLDLLDGDLSFTGAVFRVEKTNARTRDGGGSVQVTAGKIRVDGLELGLTGYLTPTWQVFGGYTFMSGKIVKSPETGTGVDAGIAAEGKTAPNTPRHMLSVWTTKRVASQWEVGGGVLYSAKRTLNNFETAEVDGYTRLDATLAYEQKAYEIRLNLQNLTDKAYFEGSSAGRATRVRGRTALLSATYRF